MNPARFQRLRRSPTLYPGVADALGPGFPWHSRADGPRSSQGLCLSVWVPLAGMDARHELIEKFLQGTLDEPSPADTDVGGAIAETADTADPPVPPRTGRRWQLAVEVSRPALLGERPGAASAVDVVLLADDAVVCVESKYLSDAATGLERCGQFPAACRGFHGAGSDLATGTDAPCRLSTEPAGEADGRPDTRALQARREDRLSERPFSEPGTGISPEPEERRYWEVAARLFRPEALAHGDEPASCPLLPHYQLARTLFLAAEWARRRGAGGIERPERRASHFAALVVAPRATAAKLERQVAAFRRDVLLPRYADHLRLAFYDDLAELLTSGGDPAAADVGRFLAARLPAPPAGPPRTRTVREMKAEARRRAIAAHRPRTLS